MNNVVSILGRREGLGNWPFFVFRHGIDSTYYYSLKG
jgi:hypothetical protein